MAEARPIIALLNFGGSPVGQSQSAPGPDRTTRAFPPDAVGAGFLLRRRAVEPAAPVGVLSFLPFVPIAIPLLDCDSVAVAPPPPVTLKRPGSGGAGHGR